MAQLHLAPSDVRYRFAAGITIGLLWPYPDIHHESIGRIHGVHVQFTEQRGVLWIVGDWRARRVSLCLCHSKRAGYDGFRSGKLRLFTAGQGQQRNHGGQ
ncbi:MAG: hypothetical protein RJQ10_15430 [Haliea sp.]